MMWISCADCLGNIYPQFIHRLSTGYASGYAMGLIVDNLLFLLVL
jgi:hypothetical protein